jgi:pimeloyl-ACP methyl ester carboxylesterase
MNALFVHGMGRTSLSWLPTIARFKAQGIACFTFGYNVSIQDFSSIVRRLVKTIVRLTARGDYVVIGHSLGGVLLRAALAELPTDTLLPKRLFLLGSPVLPSRLAKQLLGNPLFRAVTRDSGRLLGSAHRMQSIPVPSVSAIAIIGTRGLRGALSPFGDEANDGIVAVSETSAAWLDETIRVPVIHTLLPASREVAQLMLQRIERN